MTGRYLIQFTSAHNTARNAQAIVYVSPNAKPSYASTPNKTEPRECYFDPAFTGADLEVGPARAYTTIQSTPAAGTIFPGTMIRVHNDDLTGTSPTTYHENYQINKNGTFGQPIGICGVPDSVGNLPIIDGANATMQTGTDGTGAYRIGIISTWGGGYGGTPAGKFQNGYGAPSHFFITGLRLVHATPSYSSTLNGNSQPYLPGAACINIHSGSYGEISGNDLDTCTNAIATYDQSNYGFSTVSALLDVRGNHMQRSGENTSPPSGGEHQSYLQSFYVKYEGNLLDNYVQGAQGSNVKWRGLELISRYNFLGTTPTPNSPAREFDLVDVQDASAFVTNEQYFGAAGDTTCIDSTYCSGDTGGPNMIAAFQESLMKDFIYGNDIAAFSAGGGQVHYNADHDDFMSNRQGQLNFWNNTIDQAGTIFDNAINLSGTTRYLAGGVNAQNNILWGNGRHTASRSLALPDSSSTARPI